MAGLIEEQVQAAPQEPPVDQAQQPPQSPEQPPEQSAQPQEQGELSEAEANEVHERLMTAAMEILYGAGGIEKAVEVIRSAKNAAEGLANATYTVMEVLDDKSNGSIPEESMLPAALDICGMISEDYEKIAGQPVRGRDIALATQMMLMRFLSEGGMSIEEIEQSIAQVDFESIGNEIDKQRQSPEGEAPPQEQPQPQQPQQEVPQ
jgi:hypothetical protein